MKKLLPTLMLFLVFGVFVILQMLVHGQQLKATSTSKGAERYSLFESELSRFDAVSTKGHLFLGPKLTEDIIVVNFWASWCLPCLKEFASLNKLIAKYPGRVKVIGINNDTEQILKNIKKTEREYALNFDSIADEEGVYAEKFKVTKIPTSIIFYKNKVIYYAETETDFVSDEMINLIEKSL